MGFWDNSQCFYWRDFCIERLRKLESLVGQSQATLRSYDGFKRSNPWLVVGDVIWLRGWGFGIIRNVYIEEIFVLKD